MITYYKDLFNQGKGFYYAVGNKETIEVCNTELYPMVSVVPLEREIRDNWYECTKDEFLKAKKEANKIINDKIKML